jgi:molybdate transport system substrate-binding protein
LFPKSIVETAVGNLTSIITTFSVQNMQLKEGDDVLVMIKATEAMIEKHGTGPSDMKTRSVLFFLVALVTCAPFVRAEQLQVFAAASLTDALKEIAPAYEAASGEKLQFNFAGSNALARQIQEGAPADVFISADEAKMDSLQKAATILDGTRQSLLSNTLVVVVEANSLLKLDSAQALAQRAIKRIALADTRGVPAGIYAKEYLEKIGVWKEVKDRVVPTENVRAALAAVESGNVEAAIVYKTDAAISKAVKVACEVPAKEGPDISYSFAVVKESKNPEAAKKFLEYLKSEPALAIFRKYGFIIRQ